MGRRLTGNEYYQQKARILLLKEKKYFKGYDLCMRWLSKMNKAKESDMHNYWFCYYCLGVAAWGTGDYALALKHFNKTEEFTEQIRDIIKTRTMKAMCYVSLKDDKRAESEYNKSINKCNELLNSVENTTEAYKGVLHCKASLLMNKGDLLEDDNMIYESIGIYKYLKDSDDISNQILESKIDTGYEAIKRIYIKHNNHNKLENLERKIESIFLKRKNLTSLSL